MGNGNKLDNTTGQNALPVRLLVYDILGNEVALLAEGNFRPGEHQAVFDAGGLPAGLYFCQLIVSPSGQAGPILKSIKMILGK